MSNEDIDFKVGNEIWWFKNKYFFDAGYHFSSNIKPDGIELVHDVITEINGDILTTWHGLHRKEDVWGNTRQDAWDRLKSSIEYWGKLE